MLNINMVWTDIGCMIVDQGGPYSFEPSHYANNNLFEAPNDSSTVIWQSLPGCMAWRKLGRTFGGCSAADNGCHAWLGAWSCCNSMDTANQGCGGTGRACAGRTTSIQGVHVSICTWRVWPRRKAWPQT